MIIKKRKKSKDSVQSVFFSVFLTILIFVIISFLLFSNWRINKKRSELSQKLEGLKKEVEALEAKKEELLTKISQVQSESYLEKEARERFNLKKPGEEVVTILNSEKEEKKEEVKKEKSFWQRILEKVGF